MTRSQESKCRTKRNQRRLKCKRPPPVNEYLNFLNEFRKSHCDLKPMDLVMNAARSWKRLAYEMKHHYSPMGYKPKARPRKRSVCERCRAILAKAQKDHNKPMTKKVKTRPKKPPVCGNCMVALEVLSTVLSSLTTTDEDP